MSFNSLHLLDIAIGILVYTYPFKYSIEAYIPRPEGFKVFEIVNYINTSELFESLKIDTNALEHCNYVIYVIRKVRMDSLTLCSLLKNITGCKYCSILGLKDADAIAYQIAILRGCTFSIPAFLTKDDRLQAKLWICASDELPQIMNYRNGFRIKLVFKSKKDLDEIMVRIKTLASYGWRYLNFFGYQRFGSRRPISHLIGKALVKREWDLALEYLCSHPFVTESRDSILARIAHLGIDVDAIERLFAKGAIENIVCRSIDRLDSSRIVLRIPKPILRLFINAYQAYMFNLILSYLWSSIIERCSLSEALTKLEELHIPIPGSQTKVHDTLISRVLNEVLSAEDVSLNMFRIEELGIEEKGSYRPAITRARDVHYVVHESSIELEFTLPPGTFATVLIRELLRSDPLFYT